MVEIEAQETGAHGAQYTTPIADPLITGKLQAKALKLLKKAHGAKSIRRGVAEVTKCVRKENKGVVMFASNIFPVELIAHMPILCEEKDVLYAYAASREDLGTALNSKRAVSVVFVPKPAAESVYEKAYTEFTAGLKLVHPYMGEGGQKAAVEELEPVEEPAKKKKKKDKKAAEE